MTSLPAGKLVAQGRSPLGEPLARERGLFEPCGAVGEGNSWPGDVGIGDDFLVLLPIAASNEELRLGMMNR